MKILFATVLALLVLTQSLSRSVLVVGYELNRAFITANFCENKAKPELKCNGKCHLAKELKKAEQADQKLPDLLKEKFEVLHYCLELPTFAFHFPTVSEEIFREYHDPEYSPPVIAIFQPPKLFI